MSKNAKYIFASLIVVFIAAIAYLGYLYFSHPGVSKPNLGILKKTATQTGRVTRGHTLYPDSQLCNEQNYLVSGEKVTWLVGSKGDLDNWANEFVGYRNLDVEVTGSDLPDPCGSDKVSCGCNDYLVVEKVNVLSTYEFILTEFNGVIGCVESVAPGEVPSICTKILWVEDPSIPEGGKAYELLGNPALGIDKLSRHDKVKIMGILREGGSGLGINGAIEVFEIEKVI
ncbi:MAG TPA: hypothetical protein VJ227_03730 [Patescibacteria group bacterium]|nr:hypothetical protein [Patescibacteria group bacterium]